MLNDLRFAIRRLLRSPGFTGAAVVTLALAIGANAAIFSVADAVLFRPLPYQEPDRLRILQLIDRKTGTRYTQVPYGLVHAITERHTGVGPVQEVEDARALVVPGPEGADIVPVVAASADYFEVLGVRAARGRVFTAADAGRAGRPALLSWAAWQTRFAGDEQVVGRTVTIGGRTVDVVGVLPEGFSFPSLFVGRGLPSRFFGGRPAIVTMMEPVPPGAAGGVFHGVVRLEPGVTAARAQAEMDALVRPLLAQSRPDQTVVLDEIRSVIYPTGRPIMAFLLASAGLVLLLGCANLANLLLTRARARARETGVRAALGASRVRLVRPLVFEALVLGLAGAVLALALASVSFAALIRQVPRVAYGSAPVGVDGRVALFTLALGVLAGLAFAAVPAWRSASTDVQGLLRSAGGAGRGHRGVLGRPMVVLQVALAVSIVFGAVLTARAFVSVLHVPLGFTPTNVLTVLVRPPAGVPAEPFYARLVEALARRPDVVSAGATGSLPFQWSALFERVYDLDGEPTAAGIAHTLPGYFETIGIPLRRGRALEWEDVRSGADVAVVSETAARVLFPGRDPLGGTLALRGGRRLRVVGVAGDVRTSLDRDSDPPVYAAGGDAIRLLTVVARVRPGSRTANVLSSIRREVAGMAPGNTVTASWWGEEIAGATAYSNPRFQAIVLGGFGVLALGLTAIGVFGIVAFLVAARTREMGIRLAIGASPGSLIRLIVGEALPPLAVGLAAGLLATRWLAGFAEAQLFDVDTRDPLTLGLAAATVVASALAAAYLPARRGARVDPVVVLRTE